MHVYTYTCIHIRAYVFMFIMHMNIICSMINTIIMLMFISSSTIIYDSTTLASTLRGQRRCPCGSQAPPHTHTMYNLQYAYIHMCIYIYI